jgi:flagellar basal body rod protein FlgG
MTRDDSAGKDGLRLTRDGRFTIDAESRLVSATTGAPILDATGRPISLKGSGPLEIQPGGTIKQGGEIVAQIQLVQPADLSRLSKVGDGMFRVAPGVALKPATGQIQQHYVEGSAVDPVSALMAINDAAKAAEGDYALISNHDRLLDRAINGLGRVA